MKGVEAFTSAPTALSVSALCKSSALGRGRGPGGGEKKEQESKSVCQMCVRAMENMIAGRDVRSL